MRELNKTAAWLLTALRIVIGWHFLYEGIAKAFNPNWSSALYLMESKWLFSGFFHWLISSDTSLQIVDFLNIWGLILIGTCLFLGFLPRLASIAGAFLLMLYYVANPPFVYSSVPSQSHFYIVNYNLIEAVVLVVIATFREEQLYGLQRYLSSRNKKLIEKKFPAAENHEILETVDTSRREMIKNLAVVPLFGAVFFGMAKKRGWISFEEDALNAKPQAVSGASLLLGKTMSVKELKGKVPAGKIKNAELSRIMIGGNLISGFAHARDLIYVSTWLKKYFTDEKVIETLWLCEACGINTAIFRCDENTIRIMEKYWSRGGKVQWLAQTYPKGEDLSNVKQAIDHGAMGAFVMGGIADKIIVDNKIDDLRKPIEYIQNQGLIAGTAAHSMRVLETCVANGIKPDFYMKTFHSHKYWSATPIDPVNPDLPVDGEDHNMAHDNIWCMSDKAVTDFFSKDETPWIAYKVFAAGAIKPEEGLKHAFNSGADFACVGMFDFQVVENANLAYSILNGPMNRERKWYG
ncbi:MAG TPA: DoxX family protein [Bacteroidales bacterium]|nr:DoxX family protein [Bacteroidales bacterium]